MWQSISTRSKLCSAHRRTARAVLRDHDLTVGVLQQRAGDFLVHRVVLDQQDAAAAGVRGCQVPTRRGDRSGAAGCLQRQRDVDAGAGPRRAVQADAAVHQFHQPGDDGQAQTAATVAAGDAAVALGERFENALMQRLRYADAAVFDRQLDLTRHPSARVEGRRGGLEPDPYRAFRRELQRIAEQIEQDLHQASGVAMHHHRLGRPVAFERESAFARTGIDGIHRFVEQCAQVEVVAGQRHVATFNLGKIEDVVDD